MAIVLDTPEDRFLNLNTNGLGTDRTVLITLPGKCWPLRPPADSGLVSMVRADRRSDGENEGSKQS